MMSSTEAEQQLRAAVRRPDYFGDAGREAVEAVLRALDDYRNGFERWLGETHRQNLRIRRARSAIRLGRYEHALKLLDGRRTR